ncbi:hypothetical protein [Nitrososphaeria virus YSH_462411]|uniref:Uncharacterized protein n=1 Tax=Nitrososphaeria virus YSH_462411 TaxID=3071321 RepID=A0A976UAG4_9CAUD|nr:hypothetical protein QKV92_gp26 [Yangshan Harbor Nitrososphaeria virus]UVF62298.1 hypothetical protein [Nitrososphaeria virus YSH_462411]
MQRGMTLDRKQLIRCVRNLGTRDRSAPDWRQEGGIIYVTKWTARKMKERGIIL